MEQDITEPAAETTGIYTAALDAALSKVRN